jgi:dihydrofolate synthase / folylpolyglutamate synthase
MGNATPSRTGFAATLARLQQNYDKKIDLSLRPSFYALLKKLGDPHKKLPPVLHVAGTNGKGSTCATARAILEAAGHRVHVYTSPHLVRFHERIRLAGQLIDDATLTAVFEECEKMTTPHDVSFFEITTAAAFLAFSQTPADAVILEVGMGGRLDATNVIEQPAVTAISRISFDHRDYLGTTLAAIAGEKAGIMKKSVPCFVMEQPEQETINAFHHHAQQIGAPLKLGGQDWRTEILGTKAFRFVDDKRSFELPAPSLNGAHQILNAGLAIAATSAMPLTIPNTAFATAMPRIEWPARLQKLSHGSLVEMLPKGWELWLDGGHNDSAGQVLADAVASWHQQDSPSRPFFMIFGMLNTKQPQEFLAPLAQHINGLQAVTIPATDNSHSANVMAEAAKNVGITNVAAALDLRHALQNLLADTAALRQPGRILICGSLYLAGHVLRDNG